MKILIVTSRFPYPLEKGDKLRAFHHIKELSKNNEVLLFSLNDGPIHPDSMNELKKYCSNIRIIKFNKASILFNLVRGFLGNLPFQVGYFYSAKAEARFIDFVTKHQPQHIYCQLIRTAEYAKDMLRPKTLDYMDAFSKGIERRMNTAPWYLKPFLKWEYTRLVKYEKNIFTHFNNKTIISEQDKAMIQHPKNSSIVTIPNGVDSNYFRPIERKKEFEIFFNGNMNYPPNVESVEFIVKKVMPLVKQKNKKIRLLISGASPSGKVLALQSDSVVVSGWVKDVRENFAKSRILVAPMHISIGLQNKLLEAMAMQIPCITSPLANNALGAKNGEEILIADTPEKYAEHILFLLENEEAAKKIALNAYRFVTHNFNWSKTTAKLEKLFQPT